MGRPRSQTGRCLAAMQSLHRHKLVPMMHNSRKKASCNQPLIRCHNGMTRVVVGVATGHGPLHPSACDRGFGRIFFHSGPFKMRISLPRSSTPWRVNPTTQRLFSCLDLNIAQFAFRTSFERAPRHATRTQPPQRALDLTAIQDAILEAVRRRLPTPTANLHSPSGQMSSR